MWMAPSVTYDTRAIAEQQRTTTRQISSSKKSSSRVPSFSSCRLCLSPNSFSPILHKRLCGLASLSLYHHTQATRSRGIAFHHASRLMHPDPHTHRPARVVHPLAPATNCDRARNHPKPATLRGHRWPLNTGPSRSCPRPIISQYPHPHYCRCCSCGACAASRLRFSSSQWLRL